MRWFVHPNQWVERWPRGVVAGGKQRQGCGNGCVGQTANVSYLHVCDVSLVSFLMMYDKLLTFDNQIRNRKRLCSTRRPDRRATPARCPARPPERPHAKSNQMKLPSPKCAGKPRFGCFWHLRAQRWAERRRAQRRRGRPRREVNAVEQKKNQHFHSVFFMLTNIKKTKSGSVDIVWGT